MQPARNPSPTTVDLTRFPVGASLNVAELQQSFQWILQGSNEFSTEQQRRFRNVVALTERPPRASAAFYILCLNVILHTIIPKVSKRGRSCRVIRKDDSVDRVSVKRSVGKNDSLGSFGGLAYSA